MANMTLKVTPAEVRNKANEIKTERDKMQNLMNDMKNLVQKLPSEYWKSKSGTDYSGKYQNVNKNCNESLETLMQHIKNLVEVSQKYEELEKTQSQKVSSLNTQNIF